MAKTAPSNTAYLRVHGSDQYFLLDQDLITIGRKSDNLIILADDLKVSRHHATITREGGLFILRDAGSANGTFVNGQRVTEPRVLADGDEIRVGDTLFTVRLPEPDTHPRIMAAVEPPAPMEESRPDITETGSMRVGTPLSTDNPYVGPRTFTQQESDRFFGRDREASELFSLVMSERLVLFYAQSGSGKSSLINARLVPQLREAGMAVLPIGRVSGELPPGIRQVDNIFTFNLALSLDESDGPPERFTHISIADCLARLTSLDGIHYYFDEQADLSAAGESDEYPQTPYVLIIDQFEEIITHHPDRWPDREQFFVQLAEAMRRDPMLWVVLTLREDYVASLDPYASLLPGHLRARFYMQRMSHEAALEAIQKPAEKFGRPFAPGVAESLVDNLRQIRVQSPVPGQAETALGQFVEPVQLQVVCFQLWEKLKDRPPAPISRQDLQELGNVDQALGQFYEEAIADVSAKTGVPETELRSWFETQLITEAGTRGAVYRGAHQTGGLDNRAVDMLVSKFLLRAEVRSGGVWYELVHDRLIEPIQLSNQRWRLQQPLLQMAHDWIESGRVPDKLLESKQLQAALTSNWRGLGPEVEEFLTASREAQRVRDEQARQKELAQAQALAEEQRKRAEAEAQAAARLRRRAILLTIVGTIAVLLAIIAIGSAMIAGQKSVEASMAEMTAIANQKEAELSRATAIYNEQLALSNAATASAEKATAQAASTLAFQQQATAEAASVYAISQQATALAARATTEAERNLAIEARATLAANLESILQLLATATAQIAAPTPVPSPPQTPLPGATPEPTFTATPTPVPNPTIQALEVQLAEIQATQTVVADVAQQPVEPTPTPVRIRCAFDPTGDLSKVWQIDAVKSRLGCPKQAAPTNGFFAEQPFERGYMFWSQDLDVFFVIIGEDNGEWRLIRQEELKSVSPGVSCKPSIDPPTSSSLVQPIRGFGAVWCQWLDIQKAIGYGTAKEFGTNSDLLHAFENGYILRDSQGRVYVLFADDNTYLRHRL